MGEAMSDDHDDHDENDQERGERMGAFYEPLDEIPDTSKTLIRFEILEDLSDSQLMWSVAEHEVHPSQYLAIISLMANLTSTMADRYTAAQARAQSRMIDHVNDVCDRVGAESPFRQREEVGDADVQSTLDDIQRYLDTNGDTPDEDPK